MLRHGEVPDGDMFEAIREKRAAVVTDHIERFTAGGILLQSCRELAADIIVLATGLNMQFMGEMALSVDGEPVTPAKEFLYRGMMLSNVPNLAQAFGYTNASWTLKADLTAEYVCRMLNHMRRTHTQTVVARLSAGAVTEEPMMDFSSGYVLRAMDQFPKQGVEKPWRMYQNYFLDLFSLRYSSLTDTALEFSQGIKRCRGLPRLAPAGEGNGDGLIGKLGASTGGLSQYSRCRCSFFLSWHPRWIIMPYSFAPQGIRKRVRIC